MYSFYALFYEIFALSALDKCPYINNFHNAWLELDFLHIQLEYCTGGCLYQLFLRSLFSSQNSYPFTTIVLIRLIRHVSLALEWMHTRNMCHLDVKPHNILIQGNVNDLLTADFVLGDLGNARKLSCKMNEIQLGDGSYLAPELLKSDTGKRLDLGKVDIFGLGATVKKIILKLIIFF